MSKEFSSLDKSGSMGSAEESLLSHARDWGQFSVHMLLSDFFSRALVNRVNLPI